MANSEGSKDGGTMYSGRTSDLTASGHQGKNDSFLIPHFAPLLLVDQFPAQRHNNSAMIIEPAPIGVESANRSLPMYAIASVLLTTMMTKQDEKLEKPPQALAPLLDPLRVWG
jgi:hypothetical protein